MPGLSSKSSLRTAALGGTVALLAGLALGAPPARVGAQSLPHKAPEPSGAHAFGQAERGSPEAGSIPTSGTAAGGNLRLSLDNSLFAKNETTAAINPRNPRNVLAGANDYRIGVNQSGFYASPGGGPEIEFKGPGGTNPDGILPMVNDGAGGTWDGGGDPAVDFDDRGRAYFAGLFFNRATAVRGRSCQNGIHVGVSDNGGLTWSRSSLGTRAGIVAYHDSLTDCSVFHDKEYLAVDRYSSGERHGNVYVTWTRFDSVKRNSPIYFSQSSDRGVSWSAGIEISGSNAGICTGSTPAGACNDDQFSVPSVGSDGTVYVVFKNFDTPAENQLVLTSCAAGLDCRLASSWSAPTRISMVIDAGHYPRNAEGRETLSNSAFRLGMDTFNLVVDRSVDKLYAFWSDNRNGGSLPTGNGASGGTGTDVFVSISEDGGLTWSPATKVDQDSSRNDHFMGWAAVAEGTSSAPGEAPVCASYLDRRSDPGNKLIEVWASCTRDGGVTWSDQRLTDTPPQNHVELAGFTGPDGRSRFIGDYTGLAGAVDAAGDPFFFAAWVDVRGASAGDRHSEIFGMRFTPPPAPPAAARRP